MMNGDVATIWQTVLDDLRHDGGVAAAEIKTWLQPLNVQVQDGTLVLGAINDIFVGQIQKTYLDKIKTLALKHGQGAITDVAVTAINYTKPENKLGEESAKKTDKKPKNSTQIKESDAINPLFTFDVFVKGKSNALAYSVCYDMAKKGVESLHNTLFIYGSSGFGKTHLMQAVAHRYQKAGRSFCYFNHDSFVRQVVQAFRSQKIEEFVQNVCKADLLIIDDVHFLKSDTMKHTADVLLSLHDAFNQYGKCIILASDKAPTQIQGFSNRFLSRFASGLSVAIDPPEMDTRVQILEKRATSLQMDLPKDCAIFIAQNMPPDVRQLLGALTSIHAGSELQGGVVDMKLVQFILKDKIVARTQSLNAENIKAVVAEYYGLSAKDLSGKKRTRNIARPRQIAMALTREFSKDSFPDIGQAFGGRDHSTVMHACQTVAELRETDPVLEKDYQSLSATLGMA